MAIEIGGKYYNVYISSEINREAASRIDNQKSDKTNDVQSRFRQESGFDAVKNKADIVERLEHTVYKRTTKLSDTMAELLQGVREEKGAYDYNDVVNAAGTAYAKLYTEIVKRYENSDVHYFKPDGASASMEEELLWLDEEYEAKIAWEQSNAKTAALWEQYSGKIDGIPYQKIEQIADDFYDARYNALCVG